MIRDAWYIVSSVKQDLGIDTNQFDLKFLKWTLDMYKEMASANVIRHGSFMTSRIPVVTDPITGDKRAQLPDGFLDYYKISICYRGYIVNLYANDNICIAQPQRDCCGAELAEAIDTEVDSYTGFPAVYSYAQTWNFFPYFKNGQFVAGMYGKGEGGYNAGFRIDYEHNEIVFDRYLKHDEVILEWKSEGINDKGNIIVPNGTEKVLAYGVHWQRCMFANNKAEKADEPMFRRRYQRGVKQVIARIQAMTIVEILDIYRNSIQQTPKR
jgi:hypothetical protein